MFEAQALALAQETIALRSVQGDGNRTIDVARSSPRAVARPAGPKATSRSCRSTTPPT